MHLRALLLLPLALAAGSNQFLSGGLPEEGVVEETACRRVTVAGFTLGVSGRLRVTAGSEVALGDGTRLDGTVELFLDPFLALP